MLMRKIIIMMMMMKMVKTSYFKGNKISEMIGTISKLIWSQVAKQRENINFLNNLLIMYIYEQKLSKIHSVPFSLPVPAPYIVFLYCSGDMYS